MALEATAESMFGPPGPDLRLLYDQNRLQTSAILALQWCLGVDARQRLQAIDFKHRPLLFINVTDPKGREERYLFDVIDGQQGLIEFYRSGDHKIYGRIFYNWDKKLLSKEVLKRWKRSEYANSLEGIKREKSSFGDAEIEVEVMAGDFFAKEPSPWMDWFVDLWHSEPWMDHCQFTRRQWFAFIVKSWAVALVILFQAIFRFLVAFWYGFLLAERGIQWDTILHPFIYSWKNVHRSGDRKSFQRTWGSGLFYDKKGVSREFLGAVLWCFMPLWHVIGFFITTIILANRLNPKVKVHLGSFFLHALSVYGEVVLAIILVAILVGIVVGLFVGIGFGIVWCFKHFDKWYPEGTANRTLILTRMKWLGWMLFIAFAFYYRRHLPSLESVGAALSPWGKAGLRILVRIGETGLGIGALYLLWRATPTSGKNLIKGTLRDGFLAIAEDLWAGATYCVEGWANYLNKRMEQAQKEEKERAKDIYAYLACEQAPETGAGVRKSFAQSASLNQKGRLFIQDIKLNHCRPRAR